ncbi:rod-binding protein [Rubrimonas cliftonensis]|uniref:Rod binding protein n=1 Tax=Rubrimonas cliftonensis TaxID=89524 RepID=A0A1H4C7C5_9RHOB|nr:rod-binding protein [Rubrimonas cliftonensis]SEA56258.1 Rod binding protein [Rubrimonas cliftonensis]
MNPLSPIATPQPARPADDATDAARRAAMREAAVEFEAVFIAQMLEHSGVGRAPEGFGGGAGEDAFRSHLLGEQGRIMARSGGLGLAQEVYEALLKREGLSSEKAR